jgi:hypothetical protein
MKYILIATALSFVTKLTAAQEPAPPRAQIAILLDTSNSMDGLIAQAKSQLWSMVNEFASAKHGGRAPEVEVALFEYGNNSISAPERHTRRITEFTRDLDTVSRELFALRTNGGDEFCGVAVRRAVEELTWREGPGVYRAIFIAGNEPYTQGPEDAEKSSLLAGRKGVTVNTIYCGDSAAGRAEGWHRGAELADGTALAINQEAVVRVMDAPQDAELAKLNTELNATYLPFGTDGVAGHKNQLAQDINLATDNGGFNERLACKASHNYHNANWDAVDAVASGKLDITTLKPAELPEAMRALRTEERLAYVKKTEERRKAIQEKIVALAKERQAWLDAHQKADATSALNTAFRQAVRGQAKKLGFFWE